MRMLLALVAVAFVLGPVPPALAAPNAAGVDPQAPTPLEIPLEPSDPQPASGNPYGYLFNLRSVGKPVGDALAGQGIYLVGRDLSEEEGAVDGGIKHGSFYEGYT